MLPLHQAHVYMVGRVGVEPTDLPGFEPGAFASYTTGPCGRQGRT